MCDIPENNSLPSHVGYLNKSVVDNQLFQVLTEEEDIHGRWKVDKIEDTLLFSDPESRQLLKLGERVGRAELTVVSNDAEAVESNQNCVVAFINRELSLMKCKKSCTTMGASAFRWFHDGCCECIGPNCINYGKATPNCSFKYN